MLLQITETGDFVGSMHPFAFSVSFIFITLTALQIHCDFAVNNIFLGGTDLTVRSHPLELSLWIMRNK